MVNFNSGELLKYTDYKDHLALFRKKATKELLKIYNKYKENQNDPFKWGDEAEFSLVKYDHENKRAYLLLKAEKFFDHVDHVDQNKDERYKNVEFHKEFTSYMIETIPGSPLDDDINSFDKIEKNFKLRREIVNSFLDKDEYLLSVACYPMLGCNNFTWPHHNAKPNEEEFNSLFFSDAIIYDHIFMEYFTLNKNLRKHEKPIIHVPIFVDENTPQPFIEDLTVYDQNGKPSNQRFSKPNHIYMDHDGFGMGCTSLQITFQATCMTQACNIYDQLSVLSPIILALSASSPIWRGYLSDVDTRWRPLKESCDERSSEERGEEPLKHNRHRIFKTRFDTTEVFLSKEGAKYNDLLIVKDDQVYNELIENGVDNSVALHYANIFLRDPLFVFKEGLFQEDENYTNNFNFLQSLNFKMLRFKPPPFDNDDEKNPIGWRIEFRPLDLQITDFENAAFSAFVILLARSIIHFNLNFLINISKLDENMERVQKRNAVLEQKLYFRRNVNDFKDADLVELSINEIINGCHSFKGLVPIVKEYLQTAVNNLRPDVEAKINSYLKLFEQRANGTLLTPASWIRKFVREHPKYNHDSRVNDDINYDLMWQIYNISYGKQECPELLP